MSNPNREPHPTTSNLISSSSKVNLRMMKIPMSELNIIGGEKFDNVLHHVGGMGTYQKLLFVWTMPFGFFYAWTYFVQIFLVLTPQIYWCKVPELASLSLLERRNLSAPGVTSGKWDMCMVYDADWDEVLSSRTPPPPDTPLLPCTNGWEYQFTDIPYETVTTERGWVCGRAEYVPSAQSISFAGSIAGGFLFGWMADYFGRLPALIGANLAGGIGGIATIFTKGMWDFSACRFLVGMSFDNCFMIMYILLLEYVGSDYRTYVANLTIALYFGTGIVSLPWIAYFIANYRVLLWVTSLPMLIVVVSPWLVPESARWLASQNRTSDAVRELKKFEKVNRTRIPQRALDEFIEEANYAATEEQESILAIFKHAILRTTAILMTVVYCISAVVFDALVRLSDTFGTDFFLTFTLSSVTEIPAILLLSVTLDRLGRRKLVSGAMAVSGSIMLIAAFVPKGVPQMTLAIMARFLINMSYTGTIEWGTEVLPTPIRASGSAAMHMMGFGASLMSPFIVYSERFWPFLPLFVLGVATVAGSAFALLLPETTGQDMPQSVAIAENMIVEQSLWKWRFDQPSVAH